MLFSFPSDSVKNLVDLNGQSDRVHTGMKRLFIFFVCPRSYRFRFIVHLEQYKVPPPPSPSPDSARLSQPFGNPVMPVKKKRKSSGSEDPSIRKCKITRWVDTRRAFILHLPAGCVTRIVHFEFERNNQDMLTCLGAFSHRTGDRGVTQHNHKPPSLGSSFTCRHASLPKTDTSVS